MLGLVGVLLTVMGAELNDQVASVALADISGGFSISHDPATWFESLYISAAILGAGVSSWFLVTLTLHRWALVVSATAGLTTVLIPFVPNVEALYVLRAVQGLAGGAAYPLLLTTALRVLTPQTRLYGLALYALTATFTPGLATPLAGLWTNLVGWRWVFLEAIPIFVTSSLLIGIGIPRETPKLERFRKIDWPGMLMLVVVFGPFSTMLYQGDRLDWFNSPLICVLALISVIGLPVFILNEWFQEIPLFKLQLLGRRNLLYGFIALFLFLIVTSSSSTLPSRFLVQVQGFRPEQIAPLTAIISALQLVMLPLVAWVLDHKRVDARAVNLGGLVLIVAACLGASFVTAGWYPGQFVVWQVVQGIGQPMMVVSLLMLSTNTIKSPDEGPFASGLINVPRVIAEAVSAWLLDLIARWRGGLHFARIVDQLGQDRVRLGLRVSTEALQGQADVLALSDAYFVFGALALFIVVVLLLLTQPTLPPRFLAKPH